MQVLKQSTADQYVYVFLADSTDGYTGEAGVTSPTIYLSKNGAAEAAPSDGTWTEIDGTNMPGVYTVRLNATDTNTVGPLALDVFKSGTSRHFVTVCYVSAALLADIKSDTASILGHTGTTGVLLAAAATSPALVDAVWDEATSGHVGAGSTGKALTDAGAAANPWETSPSTYATYSDTFGHAIARVLGGAGAGLVTVTVQDTDDVAIEGVRVDIYTDATPSAATFYTKGVTDVAGQVSFYLPSGQTYYAFRFKRWHSFTDPLTIVVT